MAKVASKEILLSVNMGTDAAPDWKKFGCSTTDGFSGSTDAVALATKCQEGFVENLPGDKSWSLTTTCYVDKDSTTFLPLSDVFNLWANGEVRQFKLSYFGGDVNFDYLRIGKGFISDLGETADQGDYLQFDLTITGSGAVDNVPST